MGKYVLLYISDKIKKLYRYRIVLRNLLSHWHLINFTEWLGKFFKRRQEDFAISKGWCTTYTLIPGKTKRQGSRDKKRLLFHVVIGLLRMENELFQLARDENVLELLYKVTSCLPELSGGLATRQDLIYSSPFRSRTNTHLENHLKKRGGGEIAPHAIIS